MSDHKFGYSSLSSVDFAYFSAWGEFSGGVPVLTLSGALEVFIERRRKDFKVSPLTEKSYRGRLMALVSHLGPDFPLENVTINDLRAFKDALENRTSRYSNGESLRPEEAGGLSPVTIREHVRAVKIFFNYFFEEEILENNPAARLQLPSADVEGKEGIATADLVEMIRAAKYGGSIRDYALFCFFRDTGCRLGGALGLTVKRLWLRDQECKLIEKGNKARRAYFLPETAEALGAWYAERPKLDHDYIFYGKRGEPLEDSGCYRIFEKYAKRVKVLGEWNPHGWRHWRSRAWEGAGMPDSVRIQLLGHSLKSMGVTFKHYTKLSDAALKKAYFEYTKIPD